MKRIFSFLLVIFMICSLSIPVVSASSIDTVSNTYNFPSQNYSSEHYLYVYSNNRYVVFHFESEPVNSYIYTTNGYYLFYSPVNYDVFENVDGVWTHSYNIQGASYNIGGKTIDYLYSSFDVYHQDGSIEHESDSISSTEPVEPSNPTDPTDPTDPSTPVNPDDTDDSEHGGGGISLDGSFFENLIDKLLENIKDFFTNLFKPLLSYFESITEWTKHIDSLSDLWEGLEAYTLEPITKFMDTLSPDTIMFISSIWELPIIKDILLAIVAVMCFGAVIVFLGGGI